MITNRAPNSFSLKQFSTKLAVLIASVLYVAVPSLASAQAGGSAQFTLSPASGSYQINSTLRVTINVVSTDSINAAQAVLNYDASKLQYLSVDTSTSAFTQICLSSGGGGTVDVTCSNLSTLTGTRTLGAVNFRVLGGSGTTAVSFDDSSGIVRPSDGANVWNESSTGGTYTLTTPSTPPSNPPPAPPPSTPPATGTGSTPKPKPKVTSTPTSIPATSPDTPAPANATKSETGYFVAITVVDKEGNLVVKKKVTLAEQTVETDSLGVASFSGVPAGTYEITDDKGTVLANVTVEENAEKPLDIQKFEAQAKPADSKWQTFLLPAIGVVGVVLVAGLTFKALRQRHIQKMNHNRHFPSQPNNPLPPATSGIVTPSTTTQNTPPTQPTETIQPDADKPTPPKEGESGEAEKPVVWSGDDK